MARRAWVIDVCRTCDRHAQWPFCEHRDERRDDGLSWCQAVTVVAVRRPELPWWARPVWPPNLWWMRVRHAYRWHRAARRGEWLEVGYTEDPGAAE